MSDPSQKPGANSALVHRIRRALGLSLVPREQRLYDLFEQQAAKLVESAELLEKALVDEENLQAFRRKIKKVEHQGDSITQELVSTLYRTFVTPFDREDITALAEGMDDIVDYIEEVADTTNLYRITEIPEPARELAKLLTQAVAQLQQAIGKLRLSKEGSEHAAEVHRLEDIGDSTSRHAIAGLFSGHLSPVEIIKLKDLYDLLEDALDRCEDVANVLEGIAIKNA